MTLLMGPVLLFRGISQGVMDLCAVSVTEGDEGPGSLDVDSGGHFEPTFVLAHGGQSLWATEFRVPTDHGTVRYHQAGKEHRIEPPPAAGPRILFTACNGSEVPEELPEDRDQRLKPWHTIAEMHRRKPFHLLIQGGDQIYADQVWQEHPRLAPVHADRGLAKDVDYTDDMAARVFKHYFELYTRNGAEPGIGDVMASVPSLMIWDDHDIFDGWGSWREELQCSDVFQGIYAAARSTYAGFQLGAQPDGPLPELFLNRDGEHYGWAVRVGDIGLYAPDLRSERTQSQVMGEFGWADVERALERVRGCKHLFVVSSVPLLNNTIRWLERAHFAVPGHQFFQDDLRDQWQSYAHEKQWIRFTNTLLDFMRDTGARVTVLSGEIHFAAWGVLESDVGRMHQLTSSGVVHPAPPQVVSRILGLLGGRQHRIGDRARFRMHKMPGFGQRYLADRNWLSLTPDGEHYEARWHSECRGDSEPVRLG